MDSLFEYLWEALDLYMCKSKPHESHNTTGESWGALGPDLLTPDLPNRNQGVESIKGLKPALGPDSLSFESFVPMTMGLIRWNK